MWRCCIQEKETGAFIEQLPTQRPEQQRTAQTQQQRAKKTYVLSDYEARPDLKTPREKGSTKHSFSHIWETEDPTGNVHAANPPPFQRKRRTRGKSVETTKEHKHEPQKDLTWDVIHMINKESSKKLEDEEYRSKEFDFEQMKTEKAEAALKKVVQHIENVFNRVQRFTPLDLQQQIDSLAETLEGWFLDVTDEIFRSTVMPPLHKLQQAAKNTNQAKFSNAMVQKASWLLRNSTQVRQEENDRIWKNSYLHRNNYV